LTFNLEELNCRNKDLDVGFDALRSILDLFLKKKKLVCLQNSCVILEKSYLSHMSLFSTERWYGDRSSSQKSNTIEFASNGLL
jgi:hypothetical protein